MAYRVITALVVASAADGSHVYLYQGYPVPASISDEEVARLEEGGFIASDGPDGEPSESWKVDDLKAYAAEHSIELGDATKKADILAAVIAAKA